MREFREIPALKQQAHFQAVSVPAGMLLVVIESSRTQILMSVLVAAVIASAYLLRRKHGPKVPEPLPEREEAYVD